MDSIRRPLLKRVRLASFRRKRERFGREREFFERDRVGVYFHLFGRALESCRGTSSIEYLPSYYYFIYIATSITRYYYVSGLLHVHRDASGLSISGMNFLCKGLNANFGSPVFFSHIGIRFPCFLINVDFATTSS